MFTIYQLPTGAHSQQKKLKISSKKRFKYLLTLCFPLDEEYKYTPEYKYTCY